MGAFPADDPYALLGIESNADASAVRRAWRMLALRWHPDRAGPDAAPTFKKILDAYTVLSDPEARAAYDRRRGVSITATTPARTAPGVGIRRVSGHLNRLLAAGIASHAEEGVIDLFLNADELSTGGMVMISMYVPVLRDTRPTEELFSAWLAVRPGVPEGTLLKPSALLPGMQPVSFRLRRVRPKVPGQG